jgi:hypothetical protein
MDEVGTGEPEALPQGIREPPSFDEHAGHGETDDREPGERDEVDACEDGHSRRRERQERDDPGEESAPRGVPPAGREHHRPDVTGGQGEGPDDDPVTDARSAVEERGADGEGCRRNSQRE